MADAATWARRVAKWQASGRTAGEFAEGREFAASTLRWWSSELRRRKAGAFVRVVTAPIAAERDAALELEVGDVRVLVRPAFDRALLADVLAVLRAGARS